MLPNIDPTLGDEIVERLKLLNDDKAPAIILIVLPDCELPEPGFCTNLPPEDMETLIKTIACRLHDPNIADSREEYPQDGKPN